MNVRRHCTVAVFVLSVASAFGQTAPSASAHWSGSIQALREIEMVLDLSRNAKGVWIGSLSLPRFDQIDVPLDHIAVDGTSVQFGAAGTTYEGRLSTDGAAFSGTVMAAIGTAPFRLMRDGDANVKVPPPSSPLSRELEGSWEGTVKTPTGALRVILKLTRAADGLAEGTVVSVDGGNQEFSITTVTQAGRKIEFEIRGAIHVTFSGTLNEANAELTGEWMERGTPLPFTARRANP